MKAMTINRHGSPDVLEYLELPDPVPGDHDLLVKAHYSSVNPLDCRIRFSSEHPRNFPLILGFDVCGVVEKTGQDVDAFNIGDMIAASPNAFRHGANAEYVLIDSRSAAKVPDGLNPGHAGVLPLSGLTAWESLFDRARIQKGQNLLIHAGAGGVGHLAIQMAKASDCRVITTASRQDSIELCQQLGADVVINHKEDDFVSRVLELTDNKGCDASFDFVGEEVLNKSLECTKISGQVVTITPSRVLKQGTGFLAKNLTIHYEFMGVPTAFGIDIGSQGAKLQKILNLANQGKLTPHIGKRFLVTELAKAHKFQESGRSIGKILISNEEWL